MNDTFIGCSIVGDSIFAVVVSHENTLRPNIKNNLLWICISFFGEQIDLKTYRRLKKVTVQWWRWCEIRIWMKACKILQTNLYFHMTLWSRLPQSTKEFTLINIYYMRFSFFHNMMVSFHFTWSICCFCCHSIFKWNFLSFFLLFGCQHFFTPHSHF